MEREEIIAEESGPNWRKRTSYFHYTDGIRLGPVTYLDEWAPVDVDVLAAWAKAKEERDGRGDWSALDTDG